MSKLSTQELVAWVAAGGGLIRLGWELYLCEKINVRRTIGSVLLACMMSVIAFLWVCEDIDKLHKTVAVSMLIGLAGANLIEILFGFMAQNGVKLAKLFFKTLGGV